ncbi:MAG: GntR family transcriptional regulator [Armatimonadota bacterium]|nr:GntR family transcriptional regulator [Armatimonadota bacterium]
MGITRTSPTPLYYQLELMLRKQIESGSLPPNERLPSELELARQFGVSRITVRRSLERLASQGLVYRRSGKGTYVSPLPRVQVKIERNLANLLGFEEDLRRSGGVPEVRVLKKEWIPAPEDVASRLEIPPGTEVFHLHRLGIVDGTPLWVEERYFPKSLAAGLQDHHIESPSIVALLAREYGKKITAASIRIESVGATKEVAALLHIRSGYPLLAVQFTTYAEDVPIDAMQAYFRGDRYAYAFRLEAKNAGILRLQEEKAR